MTSTATQPEAPLRGFEPATPQESQTRDLGFAPVINPHPHRLAPQQIEAYNSEGYIKPLPIFSAEEAKSNRDYFDFLMNEMRRVKGQDGSYAINAYHVCCRGLWDIVTHPLIVDYVSDLIGPNVICWGSHFFSKEPHDPKQVPWHQDASYWPFTPARTVTVWLAIDDADPENAAMQFLPGTHAMGPLPWREATGPAVLNQEIEGIENLGAPVYDSLRAGEMSLHADMLAHGSTANTSSRRRCGLTIRYCPPEVRSLDEGWYHQSIICRGQDPTGNWANVARPQGENVEPEKLLSIGGN